MSHKQPSSEFSVMILPGFLLAGIGIFLVSEIYRQPELLHVPFSVGMMACACLVFAGIAMVLQPFPKMYQFFIVCLLACMTTIPAWIAFGPGERHCSSNMPLLGGQWSCRVVFSVSTLIMLPILGIAIKQLFGKRTN